MPRSRCDASSFPNLIRQSPRHTRLSRRVRPLAGLHWLFGAHCPVWSHRSSVPRPYEGPAAAAHHRPPFPKTPRQPHRGQEGTGSTDRSACWHSPVCGGQPGVFCSPCHPASNIHARRRRCALGELLWPWHGLP